MENIIGFGLSLLQLGLVVYLVFSRWHWIKMCRVASFERDRLLERIKELDAKCISLLNAKNLAEQKMRLMELRVEAYKLPDGNFGTNEHLLKDVADEAEGSSSELLDARFNKTSK